MDATQLSIIKQKLEAGERVTSMGAFALGITRLSAIIYLLRHEHNMDIMTNRYNIINRYGHTTSYAEYVLKGRVNK